MCPLGVSSWDDIKEEKINHMWAAIVDRLSTVEDEVKELKELKGFFLSQHSNVQPPVAQHANVQPSASPYQENDHC